ncbi:N-acetylmuramoyl-L-alanine amidase [Yinghuangia soli]|uniref:N-acetylmuramoyl-L-alanine amidase n=1 Tax=Yinghuangia soli TaxID=2908204 RepID=A0AA41U4C4_9ACTN|nr:N-acetylmuramoyl-L-alanine amidase [Yinghuangia soli]MCF2532755.1 N-acetylmuramoyl-L-alanine amidase [Yinghuangia soli]
MAVALGVLALLAGTAVAVGWPDGGGTSITSAGSSSADGSAAGPGTGPGTGTGPTAEILPTGGGATAPLPGPPATAVGPGSDVGGATPGTATTRAVPPGTGTKPLTGKTVVIDPGHNPGNTRHTAEINRQVEAGGFKKECDTTGTETNAGYSEAKFTLDVAARAREALTAMGARVLFTWDGDRAYGPCVDERARIGNAAKADAVVSIHGDGASASGTGFHVIVPSEVRSGGTDTRPIMAPSRALGDALAQAFAQATGARPANYVGQNGIDVRGDLGGLNLSTVPKVFIECGNMRNSVDAARMSDPAWRQKAAEGIANGIRDHLTKGT